MKKYFIDLFDDERTIDEDGVLLCSAEAARKYAITAGCDLLADYALRQQGVALEIRVRDEEGAELHRLRFACHQQKAA